jgi:hypothetical protein
MTQKIILSVMYIKKWGKFHTRGFESIQINISYPNPTLFIIPAAELTPRRRPNHPQKPQYLPRTTNDPPHYRQQSHNRNHRQYGASPT